MHACMFYTHSYIFCMHAAADLSHFNRVYTGDNIALIIFNRHTCARQV